jgi:AAA domain
MRESDLDANQIGRRSLFGRISDSDESSLGREAFGHQVRECLGHLDDRVYLQGHPLARHAKEDSSLFQVLEQALRDCTEALRQRPRPRASKLSRLLELRYVEWLGLEEVQESLGLSRSAYFRAQQKAVEFVAAYLWDLWSVDECLDVRSGNAISADATGTALSVADESAEVKQPPNNLPYQLTSFVGREREIAEVKQLLGTTRLLTLTGTGGCGKTRLALQVASDLLATDGKENPDGVWLVELASLSDPEVVSQGTASALRVRERPGEPIAKTLADHLRTKRLLLVLDNCEHLLDACARLAGTLLLTCPDLKVLATSREPLGILGETRYRVPSLSLPDIQLLPALPSLLEYESIRLFVERAEAVQTGFRPYYEECSGRLGGLLATGRNAPGHRACRRSSRFA